MCRKTSSCRRSRSRSLLLRSLSLSLSLSSSSLCPLNLCLRILLLIKPRSQLHFDSFLEILSIFVSLCVCCLCEQRWGRLEDKDKEERDWNGNRDVGRCLLTHSCPPLLCQHTRHRPAVTGSTTSEAIGEATRRRIVKHLWPSLEPQWNTLPFFSSILTFSLLFRRYYHPLT